MPATGLTIVSPVAGQKVRPMDHYADPSVILANVPPRRARPRKRPSDPAGRHRAALGDRAQVRLAGGPSGRRLPEDVRLVASRLWVDPRQRHGVRHEVIPVEHTASTVERLVAMDSKPSRRGRRNGRRVGDGLPHLGLRRGSEKASWLAARETG
jgi:hypothetical protein